MFSKEQLQTYKYKSNYEISNAIATGEAEYLKEEYKPDSSTFNDLKRSLSNKYNYILQTFSDNYLMNHEMAIDYAKKLNAVYDSYKYFPLLYSRKYIDEYLAKISKIKKIPEQSLAEIQHAFYNLIWQNKHSDWSMAAENATKLHFPDTAIIASLHKTEIAQQVAEGFAAERYNMVYRDHVSQWGFQKLEKLVKEKNYQKAVLQRTYAAYYPKQCELEISETMKRYDSTIEATLINDGSLQPTTQFAIALKYKQQLQLRPALCDTLVWHAMYLSKQRDSILFIDPFAIIDFGEYETIHLTRLLTEEQYNLVLFHKNRTYAAANAVTDWQEMEVRGLDRGFFKDETIRQITEYYIIKNNAWCRYANDKVKLWANLRSIDEEKPKALKVLDPIRWSGTTQKATNNLQLQW
jgi:hypothetical protein